MSRPDIRAALVVLATVLAACGGESKSDLNGPGNASLALQVSGLPGGTDARVHVTDPFGVVTTVTASGVLNHLAEGNYTVTAGYVNAASQTFTAQVSASTVAVVGGDTAQVSVNYTGGPATTLNLQVAGTQLIQSTQRSDGSVPMIAGRDALLRVFVTASGGQQAQPQVRVRLFNGGTQVDSITVPAPASLVPTSVDTSSLSSSWNVLIPGARVLGALSYQVVVDPADEVPETSKSDNLWPGSTPRAVTVQSVPAFNLKFVPVKVAGVTGGVSNSNKDAFAESTRRMHPLGTVAVSVHGTFTTQAAALVADDNNGSWSQVLGEVYALRNADGFSGDYVGIVPTSYNSGIAGLGYIGAPAALGWDKNGSAPGVIAHELGHNFGRAHAPCGNPAGPDPSYPYVNASIGTWGLDLPALTLKSPGTYKDLMSYCDPDWISDYNYMQVLNFRAGNSFLRSDSTAKDGLMVWGRVRNGTVVLEPAFRVRAPASLPDRPGRNSVAGYDAAGNKVFGLSFDGLRVADLPSGEEQHFAFVVPLSQGELTRLSTLQLTGKGLTARQRRTVPSAGLRAPVASKASGATEIRWDPTYPLAVVRNRAGEIVSFARGGVAHIPDGTGPVTIELSEGVSSLPGSKPETP